MIGAAAFDPAGFVARWNAWYPASVPVEGTTLPTQVANVFVSYR